MAEVISEVRCGSLLFPVRTSGPGDGEPVVLLHGFPQTSAMWVPYLRRLSAAGFRAIAPDLRGYAPSARPTGAQHYAIDLLVADVLDIGDGLGAGRFHVVGHDWGGMVGWALAAAHPGRLLSLTSVSTPHPQALTSSLWRSFQLARSCYVGLFQLPEIPERVLTACNGAVLRRLLCHSGLPEATAHAYVETMLRPGAMRSALDYYRGLRHRPIPAIGRITVPTLYVWSTNDIALGAAAARATRAHVDAPYRFEVLEATSHWIPETRVDELSEILLDHLRSAE